MFATKITTVSGYSRIKPEQSLIQIKNPANVIDIRNRNYYRYPMDSHDTPKSEPVPVKDKPLSATLRLDSAALFGMSRELIIEHNGREYRLRLTQNDKLILTA